MDLNQDLHLWTYSFTHGCDFCHRFLLLFAINVGAPRIGERVELEGGKAFTHNRLGFFSGFLGRATAAPAIGIDAHLVATLTAQQVVDRLARRFTDNVPKRQL